MLRQEEPIDDWHNATLIQPDKSLSSNSSRLDDHLEKNGIPSGGDDRFAGYIKLSNQSTINQAQWIITNKINNNYHLTRQASHIPTLNLIALVTIIYCLTTSLTNAPYSSNLVYSWNTGLSSFVNHNPVRPSPNDQIISPWTPPHIHNKRNSVGDDSLTSNDNSPGSGFSATNQNGWFDIFGNVFQNQRPKPSVPTDQPKDSLDAHIRRILIPRVSGTKGNVEVRNYIVDYFRGLDYKVSLDEFTDRTPVGQVKFANIIATSDPRACKQLAIACHHDSKMMDGFLGAVDSAVPCAMMLELAQTFKDDFRPGDNKLANGDSIGLMFIFFDGEEAFQEWTDTDSLYGSRHLASKWEKQSAPGHCKGLANELKRLDLLMVLDLIGSSDTAFTMFSRPLKHHYQNLQKYEKEYIKNKYQLQGLRARQATTFKSNYIPLDFMQDDHVPFYKRGVPTLSLLAHPFPSVWHTIDDNYDAIDFQKTHQILHVIERFVANYKNSTTN